MVEARQAQPGDPPPSLDTEMSTQETLLQFPCEFPLKVIGRKASEFEQVVQEIVGKHVEDPAAIEYSHRPSRNERYMSITVSFVAESKSQLDALYQELNDHDLVLMTL
jgi:putative lipoic acid-binding regulatory protein